MWLRGNWYALYSVGKEYYFYSSGLRSCFDGMIVMYSTSGRGSLLVAEGFGERLRGSKEYHGYLTLVNTIPPLVSTLVLIDGQAIYVLFCSH